MVSIAIKPRGALGIEIKNKGVSKMLQQNIVWKKGEKESEAVYVKGKQLINLGLPINKETLRVELNNANLSFEISFDGNSYYTINDYTGTKFQLPARATQEVKTTDSVIFSNDTRKSRYAILPVKNRELFHGMLMMRIVGEKVELEERTIALFLE